MNSTTKLIATLGWAVCAWAQTGAEELVGPRSARLWVSPLAVATEVAAPNVKTTSDAGELLKVGDLPASDWQNGAQGREVALLRLASPGAAAYRFSFADFHLPAEARMFLYGLDATGSVTAVFGPYEGNGPLADGNFRSKIVPGVLAVMEIQGSRLPDWPFRLDQVARFNSLMLAELRAAGDPGLEEAEAERRPPKGEHWPCLYRGSERTCEVIGDTAFVEGDIVAGPAGEVVLGRGKSEPLKRREAVGKTGFDYRWPNGVIPYEIDDSLIRVVGQWRLADYRVAFAILYWNATLPGLLVARTNQADYIKFRKVTSGCSSSVGRIGGRQWVNVSSGCTEWNLVHEIGHAVGLDHEQNREDRDSFVTVFWGNIQAGMAYNFQQDPDNTEDIGAYDYGSIMHYGRFAFAATGNQTLETIPVGIAIGQRTQLSAGDIAGAKKLLCYYRFNPNAVLVPFEGGDYDIEVTGPGYCDWSAVAPLWIRIVSGGSGTGDGRIQISVDRNRARHTRDSAITIGSQTIAVRQGAAF